MISRFILLRKKYGPSQEKFGKMLGLSDGSISLIESGKTTINDKHVKLVCGVLNINEGWFRTGEGEMFCPKPESITDVDGSPLSEEEGKFIDAYRKLTPPNQKIAKDMVDVLLNAQFEIKDVNINTMVQSPELSTETRETPGIGPRLEDGQAG